MASSGQDAGRRRTGEVRLGRGRRWRRHWPLCDRHVLRGWTLSALPLLVSGVAADHPDAATPPMIRHFSHIFFVEGLTFITKLQWSGSPSMSASYARPPTVTTICQMWLLGDGALAENRSSATEEAVRTGEY